MPATPPAIVKAHEDALRRAGVSATTARRAPPEPALHTRPLPPQSSGTARNRQGSTPPPRRVPFQPPPRGQPAREPPEVNPPVPVLEKATYFTDIAKHVNEGIKDICRKVKPFADNRWHPQHRNKSCLFTPRLITRGHVDVPPPDISRQRLLRAEEATKNYFMYLKDVWYARTDPHIMERYNMQAVGASYHEWLFRHTRS